MKTGKPQEKARELIGFLGGGRCWRLLFRSKSGEDLVWSRGGEKGSVVDGRKGKKTLSLSKGGGKKVIVGIPRGQKIKRKGSRVPCRRKRAKKRVVGLIDQKQSLKGEPDCWNPPTNKLKRGVHQRKREDVDHTPHGGTEKRRGKGVKVKKRNTKFPQNRKKKSCSELKSGILKGKRTNQPPLHQLGQTEKNWTEKLWGTKQRRWIPCPDRSTSGYAHGHTDWRETGGR